MSESVSQPGRLIQSARQLKNQLTCLRHCPKLRNHNYDDDDDNDNDDDDDEGDK